ncbi:feruloyl-CoA synthase [Palleronia sp. LCG004]|uniref:feruloyl-CoA synthase n=1 Tax=Palleronia sp. LCG004 TaxID=3079304 RepID=UPI00294298CE|nr:feruloyl-CoA synthase [Palleronia sp. LCG004]WOI56433.1 feruloyl-CoA synthase [Palleronia sp. LCG004]
MAKVDGEREVRVWKPDLRWRTRPDGTTLIWRADPLGEVPHRLTDRIDHWANVAPDRIWMAERAGAGWRRISYGELARAVRHAGQWMIDAGLTVERPLAILSGNSLDHAIMALSAQYVGVPSAAISPAYSLMAEDFDKLSSILQQITPGAIFVEDAAPFAGAIDAVLPDGATVVASRGAIEGRHITPFETLLGTTPTDAVAHAHDAVGPDTVAKFLFTSGTTGSPKAVINTNRMLCANMEMVRDCFAFMKDTPPILCDWAPWSHTASGNKAFNIVLWNGGTFHIDGGKPSPEGIEETVRNLREVSPTWYFNVPVGYERLVERMERDAVLRDSFFANLSMMMYAGAGMAAHTWTALERLAREAVGHPVLMCSGLGATETSPFAIFCTDPQRAPGNIGIPARGVTLKLVPSGERLEARVKGPNVTPGYWRAPDLTANAFDDEGFYLLGDALRFEVPGEPRRGFRFDGRIAENFKLRTGTWVAVGTLRSRIVDQMDGLVSDAIVAGEDRDTLGAILLPDLERLRMIAPNAKGSALLSHPEVRSAIARRLARHLAAAEGSATRITRALLLDGTLSLARGEVTDKGSVNQRAVLRERAHLVEALYGDGPDVIIPAPTPA